MTAAVLAALALSASGPIVPRPEKEVRGSFSYLMPSRVTVSCPTGLAGPAGFLRGYLQGAGIGVAIAEGKGAISFAIGKDLVGDEAYSLDISPTGIKVRSAKPAGAFYAVQTLRQLIGLQKGAVSLPCVAISDQPQFSWRGMHLDRSRHFFSVAEIKKYLDYLAEFKFNVFHWHIVDEGGWRMESKKYPKLTDIGAWRTETGVVWDYANLEFPGGKSGKKLYGGFYTQAQIKEIVRYAAERYTTVVPEIEMPGHCLPALVAYPEVTCDVEKSSERGYRTTAYCAGKEKTFEFLQGVLDETMELFQSKAIHIGGDEVDKFFWSNCPDCQRRMKDEGLKDVQELQSYFVKRIERYLNSKGRDLMGWDEILEGGLAPNAMVMSWRGIEGGVEAAKSGHCVVMSPTSHCYFDYGYEGTSTERVYGYEPVPGELGARDGALVLGAQANVWTEWMPTFKRVEYMIFPRMLAMAEALWTGKDRRSYEDFDRRLNAYYGSLISRDIDFYTGMPRADVGLIVFKDSCQVTFSGPRVPGVELRYTLDGSFPTAKSAAYAGPIDVSKECVVTAAFIRGGRISDQPAVVTCRKAAPQNAPEPGIKVGLFEGVFNTVPDFGKLTATSSGMTSDFEIEPFAALSSFAIRWSGFLKVESEGVYTFTLGSDDGSVMTIAGAKVVNNDGPHPYTEKNGKAKLTPGVYPFEIGYFERGGAESFAAFVEGQGIPSKTTLSTLVMK